MGKNMKDEQRSYSPNDIVDQLLSFPAFSDAKKMKINAVKIFQIVVDAYEQEQLTEEQDLIFEAMLYLNNVSDDFNLRRAVSIWSPSDFAQFQTVLQSFRD